MSRPNPQAGTRRDEPRVAHACFACRTSWKVTPGRGAPCPQCRAPLSEMGRCFAAPRKSDRDQWEKFRRLWANGFRFHQPDHNGEPYPERLADVDDFIRRHADPPATTIGRR